MQEVKHFRFLLARKEQLPDSIRRLVDDWDTHESYVKAINDAYETRRAESLALVTDADMAAVSALIQNG